MSPLTKKLRHYHLRERNFQSRKYLSTRVLRTMTDTFFGRSRSPSVEIAAHVLLAFPE